MRICAFQSQSDLSHAFLASVSFRCHVRSLIQSLEQGKGGLHKAKERIYREQNPNTSNHPFSPSWVFDVSLPIVPDLDCDLRRLFCTFLSLPARAGRSPPSSRPRIPTFFSEGTMDASHNSFLALFWPVLRTPLAQAKSLCLP